MTRKLQGPLAASRHRRSQGEGAKGPSHLPIEMPPIKKLLFLKLILAFFFVQQYTRATAINKNIDD